MEQERCKSEIELPLDLMFQRYPFDSAETKFYQCELYGVHMGLHMIGNESGPCSWTLTWSNILED